MPEVQVIHITENSQYILMSPTITPVTPHLPNIAVINDYKNLCDLPNTTLVLWRLTGIP